MGDDPTGGEPFVVDIHTARDTGFVDEKLVSILKRQGYDSEALDALKLERPQGAKYENRAEFGRALTGHLNSIDWMGRSDWRPSEIQAVGWAAMRKITAEADVQGIPDVIEESTRRIAFEVLPGKGSVWDKDFGVRLADLSDKELGAVTRKVGEKALRLAASETGVKDLAAVVHSIGGWEGAVAPNVTGRFIASGEAMDAMTARLGYYLDQTEVLGSTLRPDIKKPKAYAVDFLEVGTSTLRNDADLEKFWKVIQDADDTGTFKGFSPVEYADGSAGVRVIFDLDYVSEGIGGLEAKTLRASLEPGGAIHKALEGLDLGVIKTRLFQTELSRSVNNFKEVPDGASHLRRLTDITGRGPTNADLLNRKELTRSLEEALGAAEGRAAEAGGARAGVDPSTTPAAKGERWVDTTGDAVTGDTVRFTEAVFGRGRKPKFLGERTVTARIVSDSYGKQKQQHTFSLEVLASDGYRPLEAGSTVRRKGRNVYRKGTERLEWDDEALRETARTEKHARDGLAREARDTRRRLKGAGR